MNPCFCGNYGDPRKACTCSSQLLSRYQKRISGPLLDRMDIFIDVPRVEYEKLTGDATGEPSARIRERVCHARQVQQARFRESCVQCNADMGPSDVWKYCRMDDEAEGLARAVMERMHFSARAFHRTLKLARTIADLSGEDVIGMPHLAEAVQYRQRGAE